LLLLTPPLTPPLMPPLMPPLTLLLMLLLLVLLYGAPLSHDGLLGYFGLAIFETPYAHSRISAVMKGAFSLKVN
jgi:hypothetical protein